MKLREQYFGIKADPGKYIFSRLLPRQFYLKCF